MLYDCEPCPLSMAEGFNDDRLRRILGRRRRDRVPGEVLPYRLHLRDVLPMLLQRRL